MTNFDLAAVVCQMTFSAEPKWIFKESPSTNRNEILKFSLSAHANCQNLVSMRATWFLPRYLGCSKFKIPF